MPSSGDPDERVADLHVHSAASDGRWSPGDIVRHFATLGFAAVGIADHDEVSGIAEALDAGRACGVEIVPALELSTALPDDTREIHILGYYVDCEAPALLEVLDACRTHRRRRMTTMVEKLAEVGVGIDIERVHELAGDGAIGRPHLAKAMIEAGHVGSIDEAFARYLSPGRAGYAPKWKMTPAEACALVRRIGGVPVLAHPMLLRDDRLVADLIGNGVLGLEAYYSFVPIDVTEHYIRMAKQAGLLVTGGSDCHQEDGKVTMGRVRLPYERVEALRARRDELRAGS